MVKENSPKFYRPLKASAILGGIERVISTCGMSRILCLGKTNSAHVATLLLHGVEAIGLGEPHPAAPDDNEKLPGESFSVSTTELPFQDGEFHTALVTDYLEHVPAEDIGRALAEIRRVAGRYVWLQVTTSQGEQDAPLLTVQNRAWWERMCFQAGFRKHPAYYSINSYESLNYDGQIISILLERIPDLAESKYPLSALEEERSLHMDMLRDTGTRSDAHVGRYHFASKYIRAGDVVLDAACGLGYGTYTLRGLTAGSSFHGIDGSSSAIAYASTCFGQDSSLTFSEGYLPDCLVDIPDNSVDVVVCFETLEHVEQPEDLLKEFHRILRPSGRIISSVPHDWSDETGEDPNPYHFHVYDIKKFSSQLEKHFDVEHLFGQTADRVKLANGKCEWEPRQRLLREIPLDQDHSSVESEWLLGVAAKSPISGLNVPYVERSYTPEECLAGGNALAFARDYENPWLVRSMITIGSRTSNGRLREKWARETLEISTPNSPDAGAALCALAYLAVGRDIDIDADVNDAIYRYIDYPASTNPNVLRWRVSLAYVQALLSLSHGNRDEAKRLFRWILRANAASFSVTLLTKPAQAGYLLGLMEAVDGNMPAAHRTWQRTAAELQAALAEYFSAATLPLPAFVLRETSTVMLFCGRMLVAERHSASLNPAPAAFFSNTVNDYLSEIERLTSLVLDYERRLLEGPQENTQLSELRKYVLALEQSRHDQKIQMDELRQYIKDLEESRAILIQQSAPIQPPTET